MKKVDVAVVLGGQIVFEGCEFSVASHRRIRVEAAIAAYRRGLASRFIVCGGYNFGVRYDLNNELIMPPHFSFETRAVARTRGESEAQVFKREMSSVIPDENILIEEFSTTTAENAQCVAMILSHTLAEGMDGTDLRNLKKVGLITESSHMNRAVEEFRKVGIEVIPMPAEELVKQPK